MTDEIKRKVGLALGQAASISGRGPSGYEIFKATMSEPDVLEAMAQAADQEEAAQKGEPSPWREDIAGNDEEWKAERRCAMLCALKAVGLA